MARRARNRAPTPPRAPKSSSRCSPTAPRWSRRYWAGRRAGRRAAGHHPGGHEFHQPDGVPEGGAACAAKGVEFLDAPVSGGEPKAIDGTLAIMVGGKQEVFDKVLPILQKMGSTRHAHGRGRRGQRDQTRQPDHGRLQYRGDERSAGAGHQVRARSRSRVQRRQGRARRQHGAQRQGADGDRAQFQARLPHPAASEGSAQRAARGRIDEVRAAAHQPGAADADLADESRPRRSGSLRAGPLHRRPVRRQGSEAE